MSSGRVIQFPGSMVQKPRNRLVEQLNFFGEFEEGRQAFVFVNVDRSDQHNLLNVVARNKFNIIIDLRPSPVFRRPQFNHREFLEYLEKSSIRYVEIARIVQKTQRDPQLFNETVKSAVNGEGNVGTGCALCLIDDLAVESGIILAMRLALRQQGSSIVEVNPRSLR